MQIALNVPEPNPQADFWIDQVFAAKAVQTGGVIRRSTSWVDKGVGRDRFISEVRGRGFGLLETSGQFVVICSKNPIHRLL